MKKWIVITSFFFSSGVSYCQEKDSTVKKAVALSGFADFYYCYDFDNPSSKDRPGFLYNHTRHNELNVNLALLKASFNKNKWRANLGLMAGTYAQTNLAAEPDWAKLIFEANVGYAINDKFSVDAGIIPSHLGLESAISKDNWNLSRSLLAESSPYYETGVRLNYTPNKQWAFSFLLLNGWQHIKDNNRHPAFGTQIVFIPNEKWLFNSSSFFGYEQPNIYRQFRFFHNLYMTYAISKKLNTSFYFDYGTEEKIMSSESNKWWGVLWKLRWQACKNVNWSFRYEHFSDPSEVIFNPNGIRGFRISGFSTNLDWQITKNILWRNELRLFNSPDKLFTRDNVPEKNNSNLLSSISFWF